MAVRLELLLLLAGLAVVVLSDAAVEQEKRARPCTCTLEYSPVCATKGGVRLTYPNACAARCERASSIRQGACSQSNQTKRGEEDEVKEEEEKRQAPCACQTIYSPVCAKRGRVWLTYDNECSARCERASDIRPGACPEVGHNVRGEEEEEKEAEKRQAPCACQAIYSPVCAKKGRVRLTYPNECSARCERASDIRPGACPEVGHNVRGDVEEEKEEEKRQAPPCGCQFIYSPVCAKRGPVWLTYDNECSARCDGASTVRPGACQSKRHHHPDGLCPCTQDYRPFCAFDPVEQELKTYPNKCVADCDHATRGFDGEC